MCWFFNNLVLSILFCYGINSITFRVGFVMVIPVAWFNIEITNNYKEKKGCFGTNGLNLFRDSQKKFQVHLVSDSGTYAKK